MAPRLTIGLPVFNGERYLAQSLESLLSQTFADFEIIVCDNASTDATAEICGQYAARDRRVRYHRHPRNIGAARNFQSALALARTPLFKWASADDICLPQFLERCVAGLEEFRDAVLVFPSALLIDAEGRVLGEYEDPDVFDADREARFDRVLSTLERCNIQYGVAYTDVLRRTGGMRSFNSGDVVLLAELALYGKLRRLSERLFLRRMHAAASSAMDEEERANFYNPEGRSRFALDGWKLAASLVGVATRAPGGLAAKGRALAVALRHLRWFRHELWRELRDFLSCWRKALLWGKVLGFASVDWLAAWFF